MTSWSHRLRSALQRTPRSLRERTGTTDPYVSDTSPIVVGGCGRSGTTLLRVMLDSHPSICAGPESGLFTRPAVDPGELARRFDMTTRDVRHLAARSGSRGELIDRFFARYCEVVDKPRWAEKTPRNINNLEFVFGVFPPRFLHVVRDGRDVVCSLRTHPRHKVVDGVLVPLDTWKPLDGCCDRWRQSLAAAAPWRSDPRYLEVRYEALIDDPRSTMAGVLDFVGEPWSDDVLSYHAVRTPARDVTRFPQNPEAVTPVGGDARGRWRRDLAPEDLEVVRRGIGDTLVEWGYAASPDPSTW